MSFPHKTFVEVGISLVFVGVITTFMYLNGTLEGAATSAILAWLAGIGLLVSGAVYITGRVVGKAVE